jgi:hypothetical protein
MKWHAVVGIEGGQRRRTGGEVMTVSNGVTISRPCATKKSRNSEGPETAASSVIALMPASA